VKKCASCTKDLPDAALHCVFCGGKQPPAAAVQQGITKTAFGYSANDAIDQMRLQAVSQARPRPPTAEPLVYNAPQHPPPRRAPQVAPPQSAPASPPAPPPGGLVPATAATAATMFDPGGPPQAQQAAMPPPSYARPSTPPAMLPTLVPSPPPPAPRPALPPQPQAPIMRIPAAQPPPYLASQAAERASRPVEPWSDSLRAMMLVWGVALLAAFATPLSTSPDLQFNWNLILDGEGTARLPPLMLAAVGLLSVIVAAIPMPPAARGRIAALLGLAGIAVPIALVGVPPWQALVSMTGMLLLVPSLLVRNEYCDAVLPRILVTLGALGILLPYLLPQADAIPLVNIFESLLEAPGAAKVTPALTLGLLTVVVMSLLAWLPAPVTGGAKLWAWLLILWTLVRHVAGLVVEGDLEGAVTAAPNTALVSWIAGGAALALGSAYLVLVGYGLASVVGKQLE
jgi:hypothetical protein